MNKLLKSIVIIFTILFLLFPTFSLATDNVDLKEQIKKEDGSLFEKIIAECIGGVAQTIFDFATGKELNVGFKDYDTLIFNNNAESDSLSPFTNELWNKTMDWYKIFAIISGSLILIAVFILSYKIIYAGTNIAKKNEAKESLMRLCFGGIAIALGPMFIRFLLFINNNLVHLLVTSANSGSLEGTLGNNMLTSIKTGNAITTALVIAMFIYLFVKLNIKFIVRQFTIIIFTIFTPVAAGLWIINKNVTAASIWAGQIIMNIFMQFVYCFLFLIYLAFLPSGGGWAVSLIWAMMILPLSDALMNCLQNLTSRIAGLDNEQMTGRAMGLGTMLSFGLGAIKEQFKVPASSKTGDSNNSSSDSGFKGFANRAKSVISPGINLSAENDYNGNTNPIRNVIPKENKSQVKINEMNKENTANENKNNANKSRVVSMASRVARTGFNIGKAYLKVGASMAEGDFSKINYNKTNKFKSQAQNIEYTNKLANANNELKKSGDKNEFDG